MTQHEWWFELNQDKIGIMGCSQSLISEENLRDRKIGRQLKKDYAKYSKIAKLLLLGAGESGKSTIVKQMKLLHPVNDREQAGFSTAEKDEAKLAIYANIIDSIVALLEATTGTIHHFLLWCYHIAIEIWRIFCWFFREIILVKARRCRSDQMLLHVAEFVGCFFREIIFLYHEKFFWSKGVKKDRIKELVKRWRFLSHELLSCTWKHLRLVFNSVQHFLIKSQMSKMSKMFYLSSRFAQSHFVTCLSALGSIFLLSCQSWRTVWKYLHSFLTCSFSCLLLAPLASQLKSFFPLQWLCKRKRKWILVPLKLNSKLSWPCRWLHVDIIWRSLMTISVFCVFSSSNIAIWLVKMRPFFEVFQTLCSLSLNYKRATLGVLSGIYQG